MVRSTFIDVYVYEIGSLVSFYPIFYKFVPPTFNNNELVDFWLCRSDAKKLEEWARAQTANSLIEFSTREGEVETILKDISERALSKGNFSYSRFFAIGLFRLLELANATEPTVLEKVVLFPSHKLFIF